MSEGFKPEFRESIVSNIVGVEKSDESKLQDALRELMDRDFNSAPEIQHSPELNEAIEVIQSEMATYVRELGGVPVNIQPEMIHIVDSKKLDVKQHAQWVEAAKTCKAFWSTNKHQMFMMENYEEGNKIDFILSMIHEMLHAQSFHSIERTENPNSPLKFNEGDQKFNFKERRVGLVVFMDGKEKYFSGLNEAITVELEIDFARKILPSLSDLKEEYEELHRSRKAWAEKSSVDMYEAEHTIAFLSQDKKNGEIKRVGYPYGEDCKKLNKLIQDIFNGNKDEFSDRIEVAKLFSKAYFTGELLPMARIIEKTFGKGSFRILGEITTTEDKIDL